MVLSILSPSFWVVFAYNIERKYSKKDYASKNSKMVVAFGRSYGYLLKKEGCNHIISFGRWILPYACATPLFPFLEAVFLSFYLREN